MVIAVFNTKGGVGKTTVAVNLAAALASAERRVLLVDLDSQASASVWSGVRRARLKPSSASVLLHDFPVAQAVRPTSTPHLDLITGSLELANADLVLADVKGRESVLRQVLRSLEPRYDLVVLDCPPSLSLVGVNALAAADGVVVPVTPEFLAAEGLPALLASVDTVRRRLGTRGRILGILVNRGDTRRVRQDPAAARLDSEFGARLFETRLAESPALRDAPAAGRTVLAFAPRSDAAARCRRLAAEVLARLRPRRRRRAR